jgi:hypothetical protein
LNEGESFTSSIKYTVFWPSDKTITEVYGWREPLATDDNDDDTTLQLGSPGSVAREQLYLYSMESTLFVVTFVIVVAMFTMLRRKFKKN